MWLGKCKLVVHLGNEIQINTINYNVINLPWNIEEETGQRKLVFQFQDYIQT